MLFIIHYMPLLLMIFLGPLTPLYGIWILPTPLLPTVLLGICIFIAGTLFYFKWEFFWNKHYHGQLVTDGIFCYIRHPHYTSLIIIAYGLSLFFYSTIAVFLATLSIPIMIISILDEEKLLIRQYGEEYKKFMKDTPYRMVPKLF